MHRLLTVRPLDSARRSALRYVPALMFTQVLGFVRLLLVTWLLGNAGAPEFGRYTLSLTLSNWCVPILMLGLGDVAERYATAFSRHGRLGALIERHVHRLAAVGLPAAAFMVGASIFAGRTILHDQTISAIDATLILTLVAINALVLVWYQYTATILRGLRAYTASATMQTLASILFLGFSVSASLAPAQNALWLLVAYGISNLLPAALFAFSLRRFIRIPPDIPDAPPPSHPHGSFAIFALVRLLLTMTFSLLTVWSVQYLSQEKIATLAAGHFSMPLSIAQFLQIAGVTIWSSAYAVAAGAWTTGDKARARQIMFKIGGLGGVLLIGAGAAMLLCRSLIMPFLNATYHPAMEAFLSPAIAMFILFALLAWVSLLGDLHERSWIGAMLWAVAVGTQLGILLYVHFLRPDVSPEGASLAAGSIGLLAALICSLLFVWRLPRT